MTDTTKTPFDPSAYLTKVSGAEYLEVRFRLLWLRHEHPDAAISTELVSYDEREAVFRAMVSIPDGGSSTGYGSEKPGDFRDYLEKAETKAIGRALGALGFGTQFSRDHEFGATEGRVVDSPVSRVSDRPATGYQTSPSRASGGGPPASEKQHKYVRALASERGLTDDGLHALAELPTLDGITVGDMSALIDRVKGLTPDQTDAANSATIAKDDQETSLDATEGSKMGWNTFWGQARANGVKTPIEFEALTGCKLPNEPAAALALLNDTMAQTEEE